MKENEMAYKFLQAVRIVAKHRKWFSDIVHRFSLHPAVEQLLKQDERPHDWQRLLLEWPHVSTDDGSRLAYTQTEEKGTRDIQTVTSVGKYLTRHFPDVPDHVIRDIAGKFQPAKFEIWDTKEGIIAGIELGPRSCMQSHYGTIPFDPNDNALLVQYRAGNVAHDAVLWDVHPYATYAPEFGWRMAVRIDPGKPDIVMGRALVHQPTKCFVRSYCRNPNGDGESSGSDHKLEAWLQQQAYEKHSEWPQGLALKKIEYPTDGYMFMAPYIDGNDTHVREEEDRLVIDNRGPFKCAETDGGYEDNGQDIVGSCVECGEAVYEDEADRIWAGVNEADCVCCSCAQDSYLYVIGAGRYGRITGYYLHEHNAAEVDGTYYDKDNLPSNIVCDVDGEYRHINDVIFVCDDYYDYDDERIVECADDEWRLREDCWQCALTEKWYSDEESSIEVDGEQYHEDSLKEAIECYRDNN